MSRREIPIAEIQKRNLFIATPMYGGNCSGSYTMSMIRLTQTLTTHRVPVQHFFSLSEALITRARNKCADSFLETDCTHLLFIDADQEFNPIEVLDLLAIADPDSDKDIVCAPCPKKHIAWEKVVDAVKRGFGDQDPRQVEQFTGDFVFNPIAGGSYPVNELMEVSEAGTGFMLIQRRVFERIREARRDLLYRPDNPRQQVSDGSKLIMCYFNAEIDPESRRYLSEDYFFCKLARQHGMKVWMCPWMSVNHIGSYRYIGNMHALGTIQASATFDPERFKKKT